MGLLSTIHFLKGMGTMPWSFSSLSLSSFISHCTFFVYWPRLPFLFRFFNLYLLLSFRVPWFTFIFWIIHNKEGFYFKCSFCKYVWFHHYNDSAALFSLILRGLMISFCQLASKTSNEWRLSHPLILCKTFMLFVSYVRARVTWMVTFEILSLNCCAFRCSWNVLS